MMTIEQKNAIRRAAIKAGEKTATWSDNDFASWALTNAPELIDGKPWEEFAKAPETAPEPQKAPEAAPDAAQALAALQALLGGNGGISEERVRELIGEAMRERQVVDVNVYRDEAPVVTIEGQHKQFPSVLRKLSAGVNLLAVGPAGSGKSTLFENAAAALGLDYYFQGAVQQESKILGYMTATGEYVATPFRKAYENGGLFVFEEFDGSSARALLTVNNATAGQWCDFPDKQVRKHPDFVCVMAGNTYGTGPNRVYTGRQQLDGATLDRFYCIEIGYDVNLEREVALAHWEEAGPWVSEVQQFRAKVENAGIKHIVSPRASIMGAKLLKAGDPISEVREGLLYKGLSADVREQLGV